MHNPQTQINQPLIMDLILELETMAANVVDDPTSDPDSEPDVSTRWQPLFSYTLTEARERVKTHRSNLSLERVSDAHWDIVRSAREAEGYDREAYEYSLSLGKGAGVSPQATNMPPTTEGASPIQSTFLPSSRARSTQRPRPRKQRGCRHARRS
jgi:hypothetical protein